VAGPLRVDAEIFERYPGYRALVVYADGLRGGPSDEASTRALGRAQDAVRRTFGDRQPSEHPHLAAWREAYRGFGSKPSRFRCSAEALIRRALAGGLPPIDRIVDLYNAVSLEHVIPVGGEDLDALVGEGRLRVATGHEPFDTLQDGEVTVEHPDPGEVVWADDAGVTCRRWNWRQCVRTAITEATTRAYFVMDALAPCSDEALLTAGAALVAGLRTLDPACSARIEVLGPPQS
jgi:DNA/RNA-binding domain of Phe-tRNA-synthetase-like protein